MLAHSLKQKENKLSFAFEFLYIHEVSVNSDQVREMRPDAICSDSIETPNGNPCITRAAEYKKEFHPLTAAGMPDNEAVS